MSVSTSGVQRLGEDLREHLLELGKAYRHDELARWTFSPPLTMYTLRAAAPAQTVSH